MRWQWGQDCPTQCPSRCNFLGSSVCSPCPRREVSSLILSSLSRPADVYLRPRCNSYFDHATGYNPRCRCHPRPCSPGWGGEETGCPCRCLPSCWRLLYPRRFGDPWWIECFCCQRGGLPWSAIGSTNGYFSSRFYPPPLPALCYFPLEGQCCPLDSAPSYTCPLSLRGPLTALIFNVRSVFIMCVYFFGFGLSFLLLFFVCC